MDPSKETTDAVFKVLKADKANQFCWDCKARQPTWCSTSFGVYICLDCSSNHRNMGVHISFVQSSTLDRWQLKHLRTMKVGGNRSATEFFTRQGATALITDTDTKKKYTSRAAELYKEELARRVEQDVALYPTGIYVENMESVAAPSAPKPKDDDDFFDNWDAPTKPSTPTPKSPPVNTPSVLGLAARPVAPNNPRTVTSASLKSNASASSVTSISPQPGRAASAGASKLGASRATSSSARPAKLGAKKAVTTINFEEAERKAKEEEEKSRQLAAAAAAAATVVAKPATTPASGSVPVPSQTQSTAGTGAASSRSPTSPVPDAKPAAPEVERLGIGFKRLGLAAAAAKPVPSSSRRPVEEAPTTARDKFGGQKAISSDMFFERGSYDPEAVSEARAKLAQFQGATSISSNQYYGREEEDEAGGDPAGSFTGNESLAALETAARDALTRVMAKEEVQSAIESVRAGAMKLSDYLAHLQ